MYIKTNRFFGEGETDDGPARGDKPLMGTKVTINGQEFIVTEDMAKALQNQQTEWQTRQEEFQRNMLAEFRAGRQSQEPPQPAADPASTSEDDDLDFLTNPVKKAMEIVDRRISEYEAQRKKQEKTERTWEQFWEAFFRKREDLRAHETFVRAVFMANREAWSNLTLAEVHTKLGTAVDEEIKKLLKGNQTGSGEGRSVVGDGQGPSATPSGKLTDAEKEEREAQEWHLNDSLRKMQERRRQGASKRTTH